jgi:hypothetical protein
MSRNHFQNSNKPVVASGKGSSLSPDVETRSQEQDREELEEKKPKKTGQSELEKALDDPGPYVRGPNFPWAFLNGRKVNFSRQYIGSGIIFDIIPRKANQDDVKARKQLCKKNGHKYTYQDATMSLGEVIAFLEE